MHLDTRHEHQRHSHELVYSFIKRFKRQFPVYRLGKPPVTPTISAAESGARSKMFQGGPTTTFSRSRLAPYFCFWALYSPRHWYTDILSKDTLPTSPKDILPNGHFADGLFAEKTFCRTDNLPKIEMLFRQNIKHPCSLSNCLGR